MKKSLVAALTTALVVGAASTTFAAANPFSDVPADHWAYDAVAQLAAEGVIDGYGDGTYRGQQQITRYEMAQMVARAMAKGTNSAMIDKLAAEFAEELNSLGVRVAALEKKIDNVRFSGELRYDWRKDIQKGNSTIYPPSNNRMQFRLRLAADVNKHWTAHSHFYYSTANDMKTATNPNGLETRYMYAKGKYGRTVIDLGRYEAKEVVTEGAMWDRGIAGVRVTTGKDLKVELQAGRMNDNVLFGTAAKAGDLFGVVASYNKNKLGVAAGYYNVGNAPIEAFTENGRKDARIWAVSASYKFAPKWRLYGFYAKNTKFDDFGISAKDQDKAYNIEIDYGKCNNSKPGSWDAHIAYKYLGLGVISNNTTYSYADADKRGWEVGGAVVLDKNVKLNLGYFDGKYLFTDTKVKILFSRLQFLF